MKKAVWVVVPALLALTLSGCGVQPSNLNVGGGMPAVTPTAVQPNKTMTFFQGIWSPSVEISLKPDPSIERSFPNAKPPSKVVQVYLPVYPGAVTTAPAPEIGDMGRALDADFVDGTAYFRSKDSEAKILAWYKAKLAKIGYSVGSWGSTQKSGQTTSKYFGFARNKTTFGNLTQPDITVGFLTKARVGEAVFKLMASYIVVPQRPKDTYLPTDIVRVELVEGKQARAVTDAKWISNVVTDINSLQVQTPSIGTGLAVAWPAGQTPPPTRIALKFYEQNGKVIPARFYLVNFGITIKGTTLDGGQIAALNKALTSQFPNSGV